MKTLATLVFITIGLSYIFTPLKAAQEPPILTNLRDKYEKAVAATLADTGQKKSVLKNSYIDAVKRHEVTLRNSGDLDGYLSAKKDREAFESTGVLGEDGTDEQKKLRAIYQNSLAPIVGQEQNSLAELKKNYARALEKMVIDLTKANIIEAATLAKAELTKVNQEMVIEKSSQAKGAVNTAGGDPAGAAKLQPVPDINPPISNARLFAEKAKWPAQVTVPRDDYRFRHQITKARGADHQVKFTNGSTFKGTGDKASLLLGSGPIVGAELKFSSFQFRGGLATRLYFNDCEFDEMDINKGGGWGGGEFMSKWQLINCVFNESFTSKWNSNSLGIKAANSRFENVKFPHIIFDEKHEPSYWANHEWATFYKCYFRKCEIPISVLSSMQECSFEGCRFVKDPKPIEFKEKVERTVYERDCNWTAGSLPKNLMIHKKGLRL